VRRSPPVRAHPARYFPFAHDHGGSPFARRALLPLSTHSERKRPPMPRATTGTRRRALAPSSRGQPTAEILPNYQRHARRPTTEMLHGPERLHAFFRPITSTKSALQRKNNPHPLKAAPPKNEQNTAYYVDEKDKGMAGDSCAVMPSAGFTSAIGKMADRRPTGGRWLLRPNTPGLGSWRCRAIACGGVPIQKYRRDAKPFRAAYRLPLVHRGEKRIGGVIKTPGCRRQIAP